MYNCLFYFKKKNVTKHSTCMYVSLSGARSTERNKQNGRAQPGSKGEELGERAASETGEWLAGANHRQETPATVNQNTARATVRRSSKVPLLRGYAADCTKISIQTIGD
jgi:hypothetical protein